MSDNSSQTQPETGTPDAAPMPRYQVFTVINHIAGPRYVVFDRQTRDTIAEFKDRGQLDYALKQWFVTERIGQANAETFCQIMNVQEEASRGE